MGNYRYLMIYFSCSAMIFSLLDLISQPYVHSIDRCFVVFVKSEKFGKFGSLLFLTALCGCFGVTITSFAIHFAYRFFALERKGRLGFFNKNWLILWFILPVIVGIIWGIFIYIFLGPRPSTERYAAKSIFDEYELTSDMYTYIGAVYFFKDNTPNVKQITGVTILMAIMFLSFSIVFQFGLRSFLLIKKLLRDRGESEYSRNLQKQLYKALVIQSCFPLFLMYLPIGVYYITPITGINIQHFSQSVAFTYALYPAVDPIPIIFIIDNYRFAVFKFFHIRESRNKIEEVYYASPNTTNIQV